MTTQDKEKLKKFLNTLLYSWGGDTPPEAIWAANDFLKFISKDIPAVANEEFIEDDMDGHNGHLIDIYFS